MLAATLVFFAFCAHWFPLFYIINVNWAYLITIPLTCVVVFPTMFFVDLQIFIHLLQTFEFWYILLNGLAFCIELAILFHDARGIFAWGYANTVLWACCMDAMPKSIRRYASFVTAAVLTSMLINLICVHYSFFPYLHDYSFNIHGTIWTLKQLFSTSCVNASIYLIRYTLLTLWRSRNLIILTSPIVPIEPYGKL